ncbi:gonadal protein gdl [Drosophila guanche]|uniref:Blast:Gonadal protein gdl n=1 Tax=Drosophila guanche TaxID=7266 RepID=A0A3B0K698_DROGU|nr:gonadal protein gdl [Drosophila guanche]SPP89757.1 blast:Gonadal protein gdl [Drosophila guanche]
MTDITVSNEGHVKQNEPVAVAEDPYPQPSPEFLQRKIYFLVDQLRKMHAELPENLQTRISYDLLTELANCVLNDSIFVIVKALMELQHETERHLIKMRMQVENEYEIELDDWQAKIKDPEELLHILGLMKLKHSKKLVESDKKIIEILDQKVNDQQSTLQKAGVPGFYVTENPKEIKIQMFLLDFILRLSRIKYEPNK